MMAATCHLSDTLAAQETNTGVLAAVVVRVVGYGVALLISAVRRDPVG
jgi:hypothetical protein